MELKDKVALLEKEVRDLKEQLVLVLGYLDLEVTDVKPEDV